MGKRPHNRYAAIPISVPACSSDRLAPDGNDRQPLWPEDADLSSGPTRSSTNASAYQSWSV